VYSVHFIPYQAEVGLRIIKHLCFRVHDKVNYRLPWHCNSGAAPAVGTWWSLGWPLLFVGSRIWPTDVNATLKSMGRSSDYGGTGTLNGRMEAALDTASVK